MTGKDTQNDGKMTGAEIVLRALKDNGVEHIFGYPGGAVLPIYDEIFQQDDIQHILVRHEQGAGHAAEGYARSTGKPGVMLVTSGPGATNAVTPLQDALMDSIPLVCLSGQVPTTSSVRTPSRNATRSASRGPAPSTTGWSRTSTIWPPPFMKPSVSPRPAVRVRLSSISRRTSSLPPAPIRPRPPRSRRAITSRRCRAIWTVSAPPSS